jgi:hypothetical protein
LAASRKKREEQEGREDHAKRRRVVIHAVILLRKDGINGCATFCFATFIGSVPTRLFSKPMDLGLSPHLETAVAFLAYRRFHMT